jgi:hypothetical protein
MFSLLQICILMDLYIITENQPRIKEASVASQKDVIDIPIAIPLPPPNMARIPSVIVLRS